jgi:hypothetical protein
MIGPVCERATCVECKAPNGRFALMMARRLSVALTNGPAMFLAAIQL